MRSLPRHDPMMLPTLRDWRLGLDARLGIWDFLYQAGGLELGIAFAHLFWPVFVEVRGCVILAERYDPANFDRWWEHLAGDRTRVEAMLNHVHLYDLFPRVEDVEAEPWLVELGEILRACWGCALSSAFPGRGFEVSLHLDEEEYGPTLSFHQRSPVDGSS